MYFWTYGTFQTLTVTVNIVRTVHYLRFNLSYSSSSSYCWASVANGPNALQPYWLIVLPLDVPALTTSLLYEILAGRGGIVYRPYFLDVPIFATSKSSRDPSSQRLNYMGERWPMNFARKRPTFT